MKALKKRIRNIPDFPIKGIQFKDITTLLSDPASYQRAIDLMAHRHFNKGVEAVVGIEARGFVITSYSIHYTKLYDFRTRMTPTPSL